MSYTVEKPENLLGIEDLLIEGHKDKSRGGKKGPKPLGRPRSDSSLHGLVRIDETLMEMIKSENRPQERYNDTIKRMMVERIQSIRDLRQLNDQLTTRLKELESK